MSLMPGAMVCTGCGLSQTAAAGTPIAGLPVAPIQAAPTQSPPGTPAPYPVAARSRRSGTDRNTMLMLGSAAIVVIAVIAYFATRHGSGLIHTGPDGSGGPTQTQISEVQANLRNLAAAEESYKTANGQYAIFEQQLQDDGFAQVPGSEIQNLYIGLPPSDIDHVAADYCLIGSTSNDVVFGRFYLYDSKNGGLQPTQYRTEADAAGACSDKSISGNAFT
jgi:hypothetical protein